MDPGVITRDIWNGLQQLVLTTWVIVPMAIVFGISALLSLAFIPSLIASGELPRSADRNRGPLYAVALVTGLALVAVIAGVIVKSGIISEFWPRWGI